jgi:biotin carboxyl carrier protein
MDGNAHKVVLGGEAGAPATVDGEGFQVDARELAPGVISLLLTLTDGTTRSFRCIADPAEGDAAVVIEGERVGYAVSDPRRLRSASGSVAGSAGPRALKSPMPGRILRVLVEAGETVEAGQGCVVIEAMKMQNELKAPKAGTVAAIGVRVGETVAAGAVLLVVE